MQEIQYRGYAIGKINKIYLTPRYQNGLGVIEFSLLKQAKTHIDNFFTTKQTTIDYARIAKHIPLAVMQLVMSQNAYKHNDKICVLYTGKNTKLDMTNPQKYIVIGLGSGDTKPNDQYVIFYENKWDMELSTRTQDREYIRWVISECPNRKWQQ